MGFEFGGGNYEVCRECQRSYDATKHSRACPHNPPADDAPIPLPAKKQKVRIVTKNGWWLDFEKMPDFNMMAFVINIRSAGYILNERCYVPADQIESIFVYDLDQPPDKMGAVVPFPGGKPA